MHFYLILTNKTHRPYLRKHIKIKEKIETIKTIYEILSLFFNENTQEILFKMGKVILDQVFGKNQDIFLIELRLYPYYDKEKINLKIALLVIVYQMKIRDRILEILFTKAK